jgi:hypothetical protein
MNPIINPRELPFHLAAPHPAIALHPIGVVNDSIDTSCGKFIFLPNVKDEPCGSLARHVRKHGA